MCYADYVRRNPVPRSYGADAFGTCVLNALRIAGTLLGENVFSDTVVANFKGSTKDMNWKDICDLFRSCAIDRKNAGLPQLAFNGKASNVLNTTVIGFRDFSLQSGVYFCGAFNHQNIGHSFVLEVEGNGTNWVDDPLQGTERIAYTKERAHWIRRWNFIIPFQFR